MTGRRTSPFKRELTGVRPRILCETPASKIPPVFTPLTPQEIADEFVSGRVLNDRNAEALQLRGVDGQETSALRRDRVRFEHDGCFDFVRNVSEVAPDIEHAFMILAHNAFREVDDIVAWQPNSGRTAPWLRRVSMLGAENLYAPRLRHDGALRVHTSILEWLRAGRDGIVILDAERARPYLIDLGPLLVGDVKQGSALRRQLSHTGPRILVMQSSEASA